MDAMTNIWLAATIGALQAALIIMLWSTQDNRLRDIKNLFLFLILVGLWCLVLLLFDLVRTLHILAGVQ